MESWVAEVFLLYYSFACLLHHLHRCLLLGRFLHCLLHCQSLDGGLPRGLFEGGLMLDELLNRAAGQT